jgi:quercetin dioxygenase-like cupin family protein|tara:strand:+ start:359 stop:751 length:393 start_codon:yes stop_codon:yes gene_type:complete
LIGGNIADMEKYKIASIGEMEKVKSKFTEVFNSGLTEVLELKTMRGKFWFVPPGEEIVFHKHGVQEEIYYQIKGPGKILFGENREEVVEVPEGSIVSVPPETWRQVINDTEEEHIWLIIGSPPIDKDGIH